MDERAQGQMVADERSNYGDRSALVSTSYKLFRHEWSNNAAFVILAMACGWVLLFIPIFWLFGYSFSNVDPLFFVSSFVASRRFGTLFEFQTVSFGQGFGAFQYPTILDVFWWVFTFSDSVQVAYIFTEISLFLCVLTFCFWLSRNLLVSIASGFLTAAVFFIPRLFADHFGTVAPQHSPRLRCDDELAFFCFRSSAAGLGVRRAMHDHARCRLEGPPCFADLDHRDHGLVCSVSVPVGSEGGV
jgi:hypothetical protein